ncbi:unnamed protein product [Aphanomyces euteiches]
MREAPLDAPSSTSWKCVAVSSAKFGLFRLNVDTDVECQGSDDATDPCIWYTTPELCQAAIDSSITNWQTCGQSLMDATDTTSGYDDPTSWCATVLKTWKPDDSRIFSCRPWGNIFIGTRVKEDGDVECYSHTGAGCVALGSWSACQSVRDDNVWPLQPFVCNNSTTIGASYNDPTSWCSLSYDPTPSTIASRRSQRDTDAPAASLQTTDIPITTLQTTEVELQNSTQLLHHTAVKSVAKELHFNAREPFQLARGHHWSVVRIFTKRPTRRATVNVNLGTLSAYRLDSVELVLTKCVVKSDFMSVYMGMLDKQVVAVKQLQSGDIAILELFVKEITLQSSLKGPRVVDYLGACWNDPFDMKCVMEYMDCGDLKSILASHKSSAFPWDHKLKCVQEIVHGLKYIHQLPRVHGALRSKNVLLDTSKGAKLTNFYVLGAPLAARAYQWAAPEVLSSNRFSASADIYSLGVILWELESHKVPFADLKNDRTGK